MADTPATLKFDSNYGTWRPFAGDLPGQVRRLALPSGSAHFGAGFTRIDRSCDLQVRLAGDQLVYVISGELRINHPPDPVSVGHSGDALMLRQGGDLTLGIVGHCHFFYVLSPDADWRAGLKTSA